MIANGELSVGQLHLGLARWDKAQAAFERAERAARSSANARVLVRALERGAAAALERSKFRQARLKSAEALGLAEGAGLFDFECLAFERLIEVERRRADWGAAYDLANRFLRRCESAGQGMDRAAAVLETLEPRAP